MEKTTFPFHRCARLSPSAAREMSTGRSLRQRDSVSYKDADMNQAKTPSWLVRAPSPTKKLFTNAAISR
jgi:hypothetical protein